MIKKLFVGLVLASLVSSSFAARSGFSGGVRGFSSGSYSRSYGFTAGRSGYARSTNTTRAYVAPDSTYSRRYAGSSASTVIHNNHYLHPGYGFGGGGFFNGFLGGYLGGTMANNHHTTVVSGGGVAPVFGAGQGALIEEQGYAVAPYSPASVFLFYVGKLVLFALVIWGIVALIRYMSRDKYSYRKIW
jgi:hypothetical protein